MANFQLGAKVVIVNNEEDFPLVSYTKQADGALKKDENFSSDADRIALLGYGEFDKGKVFKLIRGKGVAGQVQKGTITFGGASLEAGDEITVKIKAKSENLEQEFERPDGTYVREQAYQLIVKAGDDADALAARLKAAIDQDAESGRNLIDVSVADEVVSYDGKGNGLSYDVTAEGAKIQSGGITVTHAITQEAFEGRNTWLQLNRLRLETPARVYPYSMDTKELPIKGHKYTSFLFSKSVERPDLQGSSMVNQRVGGEFQYEIYVNETNCAQLISDLTDWAEKWVEEVIKYDADTPAEALAEPEIVVSEVNKLVENVSISSAGDATTISDEGGTLQLTATVVPVDAEESGVNWTTSDENIATVSATGLVTAVGDGVVIITASAKDGSGKKGVFEITISNQ